MFGVMLRMGLHHDLLGPPRRWCKTRRWTGTRPKPWQQSGAAGWSVGGRLMERRWKVKGIRLPCGNQTYAPAFLVRGLLCMASPPFSVYNTSACAASILVKDAHRCGLDRCGLQCSSWLARVRHGPSLRFRVRRSPAKSKQASKSSEQALV